jgi:starch-binding outer membrane protein, SusD/RagB family
MKNLIILLISFIVMSCSKDFIELPPESTVSVDDVYKTDKDFQDAVTGCYNAFHSIYQNFWVFGDLRSDDSKQEIFSNIALLTVDNFTLSNDAGLVRDAWRNYYRAINRANAVLSKIESTDPSVIKNKERYIAEAKFLRALAYFDLVRIFGDVPMITSVISEVEAYNIGREKADKIYDQVIIKDLLDAENILPVKYTGMDMGRATKGAAKALLGKVYLTRKDFIKAESKLQEVTTLGYSLLPNFNDLFDYTKNEHHSEYIFDIEYEEGISLGNNLTNNFLPNSVSMAAFYGIAGGRGETNSPTDDLMAAFDAQDLRKSITVAKGGYTDANGNFVTLLPTTSQSYTKKYITKVATGGDSKVNWKVIRYADVLLMYAEALNENGKTADAIGYLNQVRSRAGLNSYATNLSQEEAREKIYLERRLELAFEGHRWFDLVRTGRAFSTLQGTGMKPYMTVFPIPLGQILLINNREIFPQNPGYE